MDLQEFINQLNLEKCPAHNQGPKLIIREDNQVEGSFCCDDFSHYCVGKIQQFIADDAANNIASLFDGFD